MKYKIIEVTDRKGIKQWVVREYFFWILSNDIRFKSAEYAYNYIQNTTVSECEITLSNLKEAAAREKTKPRPPAPPAPKHTRVNK